MIHYSFQKAKSQRLAERKNFEKSCIENDVKHKIDLSLRIWYNKSTNIYPGKLMPWRNKKLSLNFLFDKKRILRLADFGLYGYFSRSVSDIRAWKRGFRRVDKHIC